MVVFGGVQDPQATDAARPAESSEGQRPLDDPLTPAYQPGSSLGPVREAMHDTPSLRLSRPDAD